MSGKDEPPHAPPSQDLCMKQEVKGDLSPSHPQTHPAPLLSKASRAGGSVSWLLSRFQRCDVEGQSLRLTPTPHVDVVITRASRPPEAWGGTSRGRLCGVSRPGEQLCELEAGLLMF